MQRSPATQAVAAATSAGAQVAYPLAGQDARGRSLNHGAVAC